MKALKLKNGSEEHEGMVRVTQYALRKLAQEAPIALYELRERCRNPQHQLWGSTGKELQDRNLVERDGRVHDSIRNIVLSAVTGEGLDIELHSPVEGENS